MLARRSLAGKLTNDPKDLIDDIRMAAASGTQLQEFFVTPAMMTPELWDAVAEASPGARNADVLVDTHGIGGDPARESLRLRVLVAAQGHPGHAEPGGRTGQDRRRSSEGV